MCLKRSLRPPGHILPQLLLLCPSPATPSLPLFQHRPHPLHPFPCPCPCTNPCPSFYTPAHPCPCRILYGGSVSASNCRELAACPDIDGTDCSNALLSLLPYPNIHVTSSSLLSCETSHLVRTVNYHLSPVTCYLFPVTCYLLPVTCHLSLVTCYLLPVTCHLSLGPRGTV